MTSISETGPETGPETGRLSALIVYGLYLFSIPSAASFALLGVVIAYFARAGARGNARAHLDRAISLWWAAFWWAVGLGILTAIGWVLTVALIGFVVLWVVAGIAFLVMVWFTIMAGLGAWKLLDGRGP